MLLWKVPTNQKCTGIDFLLQIPASCVNPTRRLFLILTIVITFSPAQSTSELRAILDLQRQNLRQFLTPEEMQDQGFLTASYSLDFLQEMHEASEHIVAKDGETVVGYVLGLTPAFLPRDPVFESYRLAVQGMIWKERPLLDSNPLIVGQLCVDKHYRGQGLVDGLYKACQDHHRDRFDILLSDVSSLNPRSYRAHQRVGFVPLAEFPDAFTGETWHILLWDWA